MSNKNYIRGRGFEYRRLEELRKLPGFIKGERHYGSHGKTDLWYIMQDEKGDTIYAEEQLKYGTKNYGKISTEEFIELLNYAMDNEGKIKVSLVSKMSRKPTQIWLLN